jgi:hypothetical protein
MRVAPDCKQPQTARHAPPPSTSDEVVVYWYLIQYPLHHSAFASLGRVCTLRKVRTIRAPVTPPSNKTQSTASCSPARGRGPAQEQDRRAAPHGLRRAAPGARPRRRPPSRPSPTRHAPPPTTTGCRKGGCPVISNLQIFVGVGSSPQYHCANQLLTFWRWLWEFRGAETATNKRHHQRHHHHHPAFSR